MTEAIEESKGLFRTFLFELLKFHGDTEQSDKFDFIKLYEGIISNLSDGQNVLNVAPEIKVEMINNVLFMDIINWFNSKVECQGLASHLKKSIKLLMKGILK